MSTMDFETTVELDTDDIIDRLRDSDYLVYDDVDNAIDDIIDDHVDDLLEVLSEKGYVIFEDAEQAQYLDAVWERYKDIFISKMHDKGYHVFSPGNGTEDFFNAAIHNLKAQGVPLEKIISIYVGECKCHSSG